MESTIVNPVGWFEIYVDDMERASKFYETVFNASLTVMSDPTDQQTIMKSFAGNMETYGAPGALVKMQGLKAGGNNVIIYFSCEDCANEAARVEPAGGKVFKQKFSIGEYGFCALVWDTEGNMIGLHSLK